MEKQALGDLLGIATGDGELVKVSPELYFSPRTIAEVENKLVSRLEDDVEGITVSDFRKLIGTTRKFALPLLEYFDRSKVTARVGDVRKLR
jgi:selenocysteine-specific elongation factor